MFDATHRIRPKHQMEELNFDTLNLGDIAMLELRLMRDAVGGSHSVSFVIDSIALLCRSP